MKKEFGRWFLDVAKYIFTALLLSYFFSDLSATPLIIVVMFLFLSFMLIGAYLLKSESNEYGPTECKTYSSGGDGHIGNNRRPRRNKKRRKKADADKIMQRTTTEQKQ